jgi:hypothetical protein
MAGGDAPSPVAPPPVLPAKRSEQVAKRARPAGQQPQNITNDADDDDDVIDLADHEVRVVRAGNPPTGAAPAQPRISDADAPRKPKAVPVPATPMPTPKIEKGPQPKVPAHDLSQEHPPPRLPAAPPSERQAAREQAAEEEFNDGIGTSDALSVLAHDERSPMPTILDPSLGVNPAIDLNAPDAAGDDVFAAQDAMAAASSPPGNAAQARKAREARQAKLQGLQTQSMGFQFRQIAIPLLLVMGLILGIIGGLAMYLGATHDPSRGESNALLENGKLFGGIAGMLALALFVGAIVFHWEVRRARQREQEANLKKPKRIR